MTLSKRDLILALAALGASAALPVSAQSAALDLAPGRAIGAAYRAATPNEDWTQVGAELLPSGVNAEALARLRAVSAADFGAGRVFIHEGWRLSRTEARLLALLAAA